MIPIMVTKVNPRHLVQHHAEQPEERVMLNANQIELAVETDSGTTLVHLIQRLDREGLAHSLVIRETLAQLEALIKNAR